MTTATADNPTHQLSPEHRAPGLLSLAWPVAMENILNMSLFWADSIIINQKLGTEAFAAVQLGGQIFNMLGLAIFIVASGTSVVISHQMGARELNEAGDTGAQSLGVGLLASTLLGGVLYLATPSMLSLLGAVGGVHAQGMAFMHVLSAFMPTMALLAILGAIIRATGDTRGPMLVTLLVNVLNVALNYLLVDHLGIVGSALGTSLGRLGGVALLLYMLLRRSAIPVRLARAFRFRARTLWRVARMGIPGALESISWEGGQFVLSIIVAPLGTAVIAARGLVFQSEWFSIVPAVGLEVAASIVVGHYMGARLREQGVATGRRAIRYGAIAAVALGVTLWFFARPLLFLFTQDEAVLVHAVAALRVAALYKLGQCLNIICGGIFRGAGNPQWPTVLTTLGTWMVTVPFSYLAVRMGYGLTGILWVMFCDEMVRGAINLWYFRTPRWRNREV